MHLTSRQQEILALLREHAEESDRAPTVAALAAALGLRSRGALRRHLLALAKAGLVELPDRPGGGIRVAPEAAPADSLPLLGRIAAGRPIEAIAEPEPIGVPDWLRTGRPSFVLQVVGDSMREAGILDGDFVVIERRTQARNGEIVVALVRGHEATLKRFYRTAERVSLRSENPEVAPLEYAPEEVEIQGVLVGQMRRYR